MSGYPVGVQAVGTITVGASGVETIFPAQSNSPFTNLSITVVPLEDISPYKVSVYQDGELLEEHSYPATDDRMIASMSYPNIIFPANTGTDAVPKFDSTKFTAPGTPISVSIENLSADVVDHTFLVYATYAEFDSPRFRQITQE
jgi:hypothetical protein